ncbi:MAG: hypothetical protein ACK419_07490, partial [Pyrinomonadaceae bacterium]
LAFPVAGQFGVTLPRSLIFCARDSCGKRKDIKIAKAKAKQNGFMFVAPSKPTFILHETIRISIEKASFLR